MRTLGMIAEFNPFHEGHAYAIQTLKEKTGCDTVVAVMSGSFTQRGEPALMDKWIRAEMAVREGVDVVLELPAIYASAASSYFCRGAVRILSGTGACDVIGFGSESGDIYALLHAAKILKENDRPLHREISRLRKTGLSYPAARDRAVTSLGLDVNFSLLKEPNNILALEYVSEVLSLPERARPALATVKRKKGDHIASASRIREKARQENPVVFAECEDRYFRLLAAKILSSSKADLDQIASSSDGLSEKLKKEIRYCSSLQDLRMRCKSKAYAMSRIDRMLIQTLLGITRQDMAQDFRYARILGCSPGGRLWLQMVKKEEAATIPVITNLNKEGGRWPEVRRSLALDVLSSDLYHLIKGEDLYDGADLIRHPFME